MNRYLMFGNNSYRLFSRAFFVVAACAEQISKVDVIPIK